MKFFLRETESWSAVNKSKLHKTEKVSVIIEPSDNRYNSDLVCMVLGKPATGTADFLPARNVKKEQF